ncbi:hypothetical protein MUU74_02980 [Chryseobacterium daecheongense]|uniref:hypothetical protein n=1 Tax=Chryseobacterium daecheongense TaxID=192389 RepID=UPI001FD6A417|nr:hypothetical protein [Chryseobacterium daecheongense]UOU98924.1 hypothetical protein MUU74_02980 [Chryseobacterium daecheongense]
MKNLEENFGYQEKDVSLIKDNFQMSIEKISTDKILEILGIVFKEIIDEETLRTGAAAYTEINISGLTKEFLIDFEKFKNIIETNNQYSNCKFYFLDNNGILNIGLALSDHNEIELDVNDLLFELQDEEFIEADFSEKREEYIKPNGLRDQIQLLNPSKEVTQMIRYELEVVEIYNLLVCHSFKVEKLKFKMFKYPLDCGKKSDYSDRISFAVNPVLTGLNDNQTNSFDAGDLKP